jgi:hypothetical protein
MSKFNLSPSGLAALIQCILFHHLLAASPIDLEKAEAGAKQGSAEAQFELGRACLKGDGTLTY